MYLYVILLTVKLFVNKIKYRQHNLHIIVFIYILYNIDVLRVNTVINVALFFATLELRLLGNNKIS